MVVESRLCAKTAVRPLPKHKKESKSFPVKVSGVDLLRDVSSEYELRKMLLSLILETTGSAPASLGFAVTAIIAAFAGSRRSRGEDEVAMRFSCAEVKQAIQEAKITSSSPKFTFPQAWTGVADHSSLSPLPEDGAVPSEVLERGGVLAVRYLEDWLDEDGAIEGYASWTKQSPPSKQLRTTEKKEEEAIEEEGENEGMTSLNSTIPTPWPEDGEKSIIEQVSWLE